MRPPLRIEWGERYTDADYSGEVWGIDDADGEKVIETDNGAYPPRSEDARRIVASVNLLAEVSLAELENVVARGYLYRDDGNYIVVERLPKEKP